MAIRVFENWSVDFTDKEGYGVKGDGSSGLALSAASVAFIGVIRIGRTAAENSDVALPGEIAPVLLAGTVKAGDKLKLTSSSTFEKATPTTADVVAGTAMEDGVSGSLIDALIETARIF